MSRQQTISLGAPIAAALLSVLGLTASVHPLSRVSRGQPPEQNKDKNKKTEMPRPSPALLAEDKGKFRIVLNGQPVGTEEFQISANDNSAGAKKEWTARGTTEVRAVGVGDQPATMQVTARFTLLADGTPLRYEWSAQGQKKASASVEFQGGAARMSLQFEGAKPFVQEFSFGASRVVILDNNLYHHYAILARLYDWNGKGAQTFPVLIPQDMTPGSITVEALGPRDISGASLELLRVRTADLEVDLYLDASRRLVRLDVPSSKAEILRE